MNKYLLLTFLICNCANASTCVALSYDPYKWTVDKIKHYEDIDSPGNG